MAFADFYLKKYPTFGRFISSKPAEDLSVIVTIPCLNEPCLINSLESLLSCEAPAGSCEVIVAVNSSEKATSAVIAQNQKTIEEAGKWVKLNQTDKIKIHIIHAPDLKAKHAGAGWARKIAMDEAVRRCNMLDNPQIIITGFDADSECSPNYLRTVEAFFAGNSMADAASIYFEHPYATGIGAALNDVVIAKYELHLRYLLHAVRSTGFPHAFHTVGSSFAVRARTYIKQGGMNRRTAGEDFYFLNKIIEANTFADCTETVVYPSSRQSDRVPFGTGATITKHLAEQNAEYETYSFSAFSPLKELFAEVRNYYKINENRMPLTADKVLNEFLESNCFTEAVRLMNENSASLGSFTKRFFQWFNMFRLVKYLNFAHQTNYTKSPVENEAQSLLCSMNMSKTARSDTDALLKIYREIDKYNQHKNIPTLF